MLDLMGQLTQLRGPRAMHAGADHDALLDCAGPLDDTRVLLIGSNTIELMCALIRRNCAGVMARRPGDRPEAASADLVLIPSVPSDGVGRVLAQARRALVPLGSLVLCLPATMPAETARLVRHQLRAHGFDAIRSRVIGRQYLLRAEVPFFGCRAAA